MVAISAAIASCSNPANVIVGTPPFLNQKCDYKSLDDILTRVKDIATSNDLKVKVDVTDKDLGVFSILFWKEDFNLVVAGIPETKSLYYSAIKRGKATENDTSSAVAVQRALSIECQQQT